MIKSKRRYEGHLLIDNRCNEGVPDEMMLRAGLPAGSGRGLFEAATYTCSHCQAVVVIEPRRTRERAYCAGCDHYICDACGVARAANGGACKTFRQIVEETQERAVRDAQRNSIILSA